MAGDWESEDEDDANDTADTIPDQICQRCAANGNGIGIGKYLGMLGRWDWFRCRNCGLEFHA